MSAEKFTIEGRIPWSELQEKVRQITLLHPRDGETIYPYEDAEIKLAEVHYDEVRPTSLYVLRQNLAIQSQIATLLSGEGLHPLELEGGVIIGDSDSQTGLVPPVVEETEAEGTYILDGSHRTNMGRWAGRTSFAAIHISGIRSDCPAYAFPNDWDEVRIRDTLPENPADRKHYRGENYYELYRNFGPINGSKPRT